MQLEAVNPIAKKWHAPTQTKVILIEKGRMELKPFNAVTTSFLATSLLVSGISPAFAEGNSTPVDKLEQYLQHATQEDRERIHEGQMQAGEKFVSPEINVHSDEEIAVIVQFSQDPAEVEVKKKELKGEKVSLQAAKEKVQKVHHQFKEKITKKQAKAKGKSSIQIGKEYRQAFNGVAMKLPASEVKELLKYDEVKAVYVDAEIRVDPVPLSEETTGSSPAMDSLTQISAPAAHAEGFTGEGIKVGVLDTGIDYHHPDLKEAYKGGYDLINNDDDPMETTYEEWLDSGLLEYHPLGGSTYYTSHGTHVAGTIAGRAENKEGNGVKGVAPDADIYAYKVLGPYGSGAMSIVMAGIEKAVKDGMDVINLSLGGSSLSPLDPTSIAIDNAMLSGTVAVVAAGNSGDDQYTLGAPGTASLGITVGASDYSVTASKAEGALVNGSESMELTSMRLLGKDFGSLDGLLGSEAAITYVGIGRNADYEGKDVEGKVVLISRGTNGVNEKIYIAKQHGAKAALIFNNNPEEGHIPYYFGEEVKFIPGFSLTYEDGQAILESLKEDSTFSFNHFEEVQSDGDHLASFSSRGPTRITHDIKPEIVAPGVGVYSSVPSYMQGSEYIGNYDVAYKRASGTSMAAPHVAGAAAVLLQENPDLKPEDVKTALMNTADEVKGDTSVFERGAGRIDVYEAMHADVEIEVEHEILTAAPDSESHAEETHLHESHLVDQIIEHSGDLSFGGISKTGENLSERLSVTLHNNSDEQKKFAISFEENQIDGNQSMKENGVSLSFPKSANVKAGKDKDQNVFLNIPKTAKPGFYEGMVTFTNKENPDEVYQLPVGFRLLETGIKEVTAHFTSFTTRRDFNNGYMGYSPISFSLNNGMEKVDIVLKDADTGKGLGVIDSFPFYLPEDYLFGLEFGFVGLYYPFTGNAENPVAYSKTMAPPGNYKVEIVATDSNGKTYRKSDNLFIENTLPEVDMKQKGGVYEVTDEGLVINGNIYNNQIDKMKEYGETFDQSTNTVNVLSSSPYKMTPVNVDGEGDFEASLQLPEGKETGKFTLNYYDQAVNGMKDHPDQTYDLIREGTPYAKLSSTKSDAKYGESLSLNLSSHHTSIHGATYDVRYDNSVYEEFDVTISEELRAFADEQGVEIVTEAKDSVVSGTRTTIPVTLTVNGELNEDIPNGMNLLDIHVKVKQTPDLYKKWIYPIELTKSEVTSSTGETSVIQSFGKGINILPTHSQLEGGFLPDGFTDGVWLRPGLDMSSVGAKVSLTDQSGNVRDGSINPRARYTFNELPVTHEEYDIKITLPGHFARHATISHLGDEFNGEPTGRMTYIFYAEIQAGDVTQDDVIDIMDAIEIQEHYGTDHREADINYDGTVDKTDLQYIIDNYLVQNPDVANPPAGKTEYNGKTLDDIVSELN
ncbi:S8 family serine peptidase [Rossellomorea yichunensis]|uniref:S8 family serine peptidase n=1 Tax=Rossellomorea yichunensis TaxID=3077331 RepID=UPI0028DE13EE|nr:S8 family serine peptidase [Rossellomorea sp. YC4-1]MDT9025528.1 S8 family serine peptidase [Rossellomorea sp. YC4-1]